MRRNRSIITMSSHFLGPRHVSKIHSLSWYCYDTIIRINMSYELLPPHLLVELLDASSQKCDMCKQRTLAFYYCRCKTHDKVKGKEKYCANCVDMRRIHCLKCVRKPRSGHNRRLKWLTNDVSIK